jgi:prepilin-type N-terminal cleavage/methylation domain-containing protein
MQFFLPVHDKNINNNNKTGFSMIELAIVLIIIALIVGGIMVSKNMTKNAKLRSIATQSDQYIAAIKKFNDKYQSMPGDMINATTIWGRADAGAPITANCATPETNQDTALLHATCNGDGDGFIADDAATDYEIFRAWQHLKNDGLITGNFSGIVGGAGNSKALVGTNIPTTMLARIGFDIKYIPDTAIPADYFTNQTYGHVIHIGTEIAGNNLAHGLGLSSRQANDLDSKFDDATPATGNIISKNQATCAASATSYITAQSEGAQCVLLFKTGF